MERPEQIRTREYLRDRGSLLPVARIRDRVGAAFDALEAVLADVTEGTARARPASGEWSIAEVVDHLVETHRPSLGELEDLLAGRRPAGPPIPAALQSADPAARSWPDLLGELQALHEAVLEALARASDEQPAVARAPVVMVVNVREPDKREVPLHWVEELDWKAYAIVFRLHTLDHLGQVKQALAAAGSEG